MKGSKSHVSLLTSQSRMDVMFPEGEASLRRTDSCGSLDSHTHKQQPETGLDSEQPTEPFSTSGRQPQATQSFCTSKLHIQHRRQSSDTNRTAVHPRHRPRVPHAPPSSSSGYSTGDSPSVITTTDSTLKSPRPATAHSGSGDQHGKQLRVCTSVSSDPVGSSFLHLPQYRSTGSLGDRPKVRSPTRPQQASQSFRSLTQEVAEPPLHSRCNMATAIDILHHRSMTHVIRNESLVWPPPSPISLTVIMLLLWSVIRNTALVVYINACFMSLSILPKHCFTKDLFFNQTWYVYYYVWAVTTIHHSHGVQQLVYGSVCV